MPNALAFVLYAISFGISLKILTHAFFILFCKYLFTDESVLSPSETTQR